LQKFQIPLAALTTQHGLSNMTVLLHHESDFPLITSAYGALRFQFKSNNYFLRKKSHMHNIVGQEEYLIYYTRVVAENYMIDLEVQCYTEGLIENYIDFQMINDPSHVEKKGCLLSQKHNQSQCTTQIVNLAYLSR
jgi:hypothetical protein